MVSGSVSLLCSRFFSPFPHGTGSLSVSREYLALRDGPRGFGQDFSCPGLLRCRLRWPAVFAYGAFTRCGPTFQTVPLTSDCSFVDGPTTPHYALPRMRFGLMRVRSPLLAQSLVCFLFLRVLRCFSSPGSPPPLWRMPESPPAGCPIRISAIQWIFAPTRGFSQLVTSFFASESLGILHAPFSPFL